MSGILEILGKGGVMIYPLLVTSVAGLAVVIERAFFLRRKRIIRPDVLAVIRHSSLKEVSKAIAEFAGREGAFLNIIKTGLANQGRTREEIKEVILDRGRQEARSLERGLGILETIAGIAPLMGLMGTVIGMIKVFRVISEQGLGQTQALSSGISEALVTTVVGLAIAIPALVAFNFFTHKVEDLVLEIEEHSAYLLDKLASVPEK